MPIQPFKRGNVNEQVFEQMKDCSSMESGSPADTENALMIRTYSILTDVLHTATEEVVTRMEPDAGYYYHTQIVNTISKHDCNRAHELMQRHIEANIAQYTELS